MSEATTSGLERWSGLIRVRIHGRGGHGIKTAGRIVGTAAFLAGFQAQDAPIYGAERRGAAVASFVRISDRPILERGPIGAPDVLVVADETLVADSTAGVVAGQAGARAIFVNTLDPVALRTSFPSGKTQGEDAADERLQGLDLSGRTKAALGRASALSAGLAAAAARLTGVIPVDSLVAALREEFAELGVAADVQEKNVELAVAVFAALRPVELIGGERMETNLPSPRVVELVPEAPRISAPTILRPGNSALRHTGAWRLDRPVPDLSTCSRCGLCFAMCPDGAITLNEQGYPVIDYDHCKGCMICQQLCPLHAIEREPETRAW